LPSGQGTGTRADSALGSSGGTSEVLSQNGTLSNDNNVLARELLLKFADQTLLVLVVATEQTEGNGDNDGLLSAGNINFLSGRDLQVAQVTPRVFSSRHLKVQKLLCNILLEFGRRGTFSLRDFRGPRTSRQHVNSAKR
jgi:hypothetical protein